MRISQPSPDSTHGEGTWPGQLRACLAKPSLPRINYAKCTGCRQDTAYTTPALLGKMISRFEDILAQTPSGCDIRETLLQWVDSATLRCLRGVSHVCHNILNTHRAEFMFQKLYLNTPLPSFSDTTSLAHVSPLCQQLTIKVGYVQRSSNSGVSNTMDLIFSHEVKTVRQLRSKGSLFRTRNQSTPIRRSQASLETIRASFETAASPIELFALDKNRQARMRQQWIKLLSRFERLETLTLRIDGDPAWPGYTDVEHMLVTLRIAIESTDLRHLRTSCLGPVHAMGIIHLRWLSMDAFGRATAAEASVWPRLHGLDIWIHNPFTTKCLSEAQATIFKKVLYEYLRGFAPTLRCLRFVWLDSDGPSPLTLHLDLDLQDRADIHWFKLEELWFGNITLPRMTAKLVREVAPNLTRLMTLRSTHRHASLNVNDSSAWMKMTGFDEANHNDETDLASSIYSQSTRSEGSACPGGHSRTSRDLRFYRDF